MRPRGGWGVRGPGLPELPTAPAGTTGTCVVAVVVPVTLNVPRSFRSGDSAVAVTSTCAVPPPGCHVPLHLPPPTGVSGMELSPFEKHTTTEPASKFPPQSPTTPTEIAVVHPP